jgi:hypothetical protein
MALHAVEANLNFPASLPKMEKKWEPKLGRRESPDRGTK